MKMSLFRAAVALLCMSAMMVIVVATDPIPTELNPCPFTDGDASPCGRGECTCPCADPRDEWGTGFTGGISVYETFDPSQETPVYNGDLCAAATSVEVKHIRPLVAPESGVDIAIRVNSNGASEYVVGFAGYARGCADFEETMFVGVTNGRLAWKGAASSSLTLLNDVNDNDDVRLVLNYKRNGLLTISVEGTDISHTVVATGGIAHFGVYAQGAGVCVNRVDVEGATVDSEILTGVQGTYGCYPADSTGAGLDPFCNEYCIPSYSGYCLGDGNGDSFCDTCNVVCAAADIANGATYALKNHPGGSGGPPEYGLRIDGLLQGNYNSQTTSFSFEHSESTIKLQYTPKTTTTGSIEISGHIFGGEHYYGGYKGGGELFYFFMRYPHVQVIPQGSGLPYIVADGDDAEFEPADGFITRISDQMTWQLHGESNGNNEFFYLEENHRGAGSGVYGGAGWVQIDGWSKTQWRDLLFIVDDFCYIPPPQSCDRSACEGIGRVCNDNSDDCGECLPDFEDPSDGSDTSIPCTETQTTPTPTPTPTPTMTPTPTPTPMPNPCPELCYPLPRFRARRLARRDCRGLRALCRVRLCRRPNGRRGFECGPRM